MSTIQGDDRDVWDAKVDIVLLSMFGHNMVVNFEVNDTSKADVILGKEWLHALGSSLKHSYEHKPRPMLHM